MYEHTSGPTGLIGHAGPIGEPGEFVQGTISQEGEPGRLRTFRLKTESGLKFLVRSGGKYQGPQTTVEIALEAVEKIKNVHPNAEISVEVDIR